VPWHDAHRLDRELAHAEQAVLDVERRLGDVDRGDHGVGDADRLEVDRPAGVGLLRIGRAFAGKGGGSNEARAEDCAGEKKTAAEAACV
jgi:hypothetical protein